MWLLIFLGDFRISDLGFANNINSTWRRGDLELKIKHINGGLLNTSYLLKLKKKKCLGLLDLSGVEKFNELKHIFKIFVTYDVYSWPLTIFVHKFLSWCILVTQMVCKWFASCLWIVCCYNILICMYYSV